MNSKSIGSILLIIGTTIGAGMLSLPLVIAACGFTTAIVLLVMSWSVMYITSLKLLSVCAKYPLGEFHYDDAKQSIKRVSASICFDLFITALFFDVGLYYTRC